MKIFLISLISTAALSLALQLFLPWWIIAVAAFVIAMLIEQKSFAAFLSGFLAVFLLWTGYALMLSGANNDILLTKITELLKALTGGNKIVVYLLTGLVGGLVAGFAALTGSLARKIMEE